MDTVAANLPHTHSWIVPVLKKYGLATVLSLVFAWFLLFVVHDNLKANGAKTDAVKATLDQHAADMYVDQARAQAIQEQQLRALVQLCKNAATSKNEERLCEAVK